eukprot:scaffold183_cov249-Pinguiococcus_pyrenoidosus.AAC.24
MSSAWDAGSSARSLINVRSALQDSLPYFGDLDEVFAAVSTLLRKGAVFAFNLDTFSVRKELRSDFHQCLTPPLVLHLFSPQDSASAKKEGYQLRHTGRWMHTYVVSAAAAGDGSCLPSHSFDPRRPSYARKLAAQHGLTVIREVSLRGRGREVLWDDSEQSRDRLVSISGTIFILAN